MRKLAIIVLGVILAGCGQQAETSIPTEVAAASPVLISSQPVSTNAVVLPSMTPSTTMTNSPSTTDIPGLSSVPLFSSVGADWKRLYPTAPLACAHGTQYSFWARQGASDNLLIFFEGGGGCWNAESCARSSRAYNAEVNDDDSPVHRGGILDFANPDNPFMDYDMVFIPVCTGDLHMGNYTRTYTDANGASITIQHVGFLNASTVLSWVYAGIPNPASVFVAGCSAGSVGSVAHAPYIIEHYPNVPVTQLGDSLGFVFQSYLDQETKQRTLEDLAQWVPGLAALTPESLSLSQLYIAEATHYPQQRFAQTNFNADEIQQLFYQALGGDIANWYTDLSVSLDAIHASVPNFYSFTAAGTGHCILPSDLFYMTEANGVRFRDWVAGYASGADVPQRVQCAECAVTTP